MKAKFRVQNRGHGLTDKLKVLELAWAETAAQAQAQERFSVTAGQSCLNSKLTVMIVVKV